MHNVTSQFVTAEYPVLSVVHEPAPANGPAVGRTRLRDATFIGGRVRPDGLALVRIRGANMDPRGLTAYAFTPGFVVEVCAERTRCGEAMIVGLRVMRGRSDRPECRIRFVCGGAFVDATVAVG